jgi:hypothetical protein
MLMCINHRLARLVLVSKNDLLNSKGKEEVVLVLFIHQKVEKLCTKFELSFP